MDVFQKELNSCFFTRERLRCDLCGKYAKSIVDFRGIGFGCFVSGFINRNPECWREMMESAFYENPDRAFVEARIIEDTLFERRKETRKITRSKMTLSLRFSILHRDNFRCVLCGRRPPEVKLEVDHIKTVADGGTSTEDNLRTLCFNCNHGR